MLCVRPDAGHELVAGRIYLLKSRNPDGDVEVARFAMPTPSEGQCYSASLFRWIRPHVADPQDGWTIALMQGSGVDGDAQADLPSWWRSAHASAAREIFNALEIRGS
jgi:hypothetical protein